MVMSGAKFPFEVQVFEGEGGPYAESSIEDGKVLGAGLFKPIKQKTRWKRQNRSAKEAAEVWLEAVLRLGRLKSSFGIRFEAKTLSRVQSNLSFLNFWICIRILSNEAFEAPMSDFLRATQSLKFVDIVGGTVKSMSDTYCSCGKVSVSRMVGRSTTPTRQRLRNDSNALLRISFVLVLVPHLPMTASALRAHPVYLEPPLAK